MNDCSLLYCIVDSSVHSRTLLGIGNRPVAIVRHRELGAAVSYLDSSDSLSMPPTVEAVRAFDRVVTTLSNKGAVIPVRYGCLLGTLEVLSTRYGEFTRRLDELRDRVEMAIRILLPPVDVSHAQAAEKPTSITTSIPTSASGSMSPSASGSMSSSARGSMSSSARGSGTASASGPGRAFLEARRRHHAGQDWLVRRAESIADKVSRNFSALAVRSRTEFSATPKPPYRCPTLSVYFLVERASVPAFRQTFRGMGRDDEYKVLLSGPWPPYNFAALTDPVTC
ncbi:MAG: GvpL/GvpF family gas vesicle protein [Proteobacteria bacterium]|nr:GvpL/GvpF family gas vesicle protein [Pseudomonadota bacterium]